MLRSILSVLAGFAAMTGLVMAATIVSARLMLGIRGREEMMKVKPTPKFIAVNLVYSAAFAVLGGFLTAFVAGRAPLSHAFALAGLLLIMAIFSHFQAAKSNQPKWYGFLLMLLGPACALLGGWLQALRAAA